MTRVLCLIVALAVVGSAAEPRREAFPVAPAVTAAFQSGGLAAFDPFDPWNAAGVGAGAGLPPANPGEDAARLPAGACYDVLPAWTARGFRPRAGTRAWFHPGTGLLFAVMAPEDAAQVRAFAAWPPAVWLAPRFLNDSIMKQVVHRVTAWEVPAEGPGGWQFLPETPAQLMALPAGARRIVARQSVIVRAGQRSKAEDQAISRTRPGPPLSGFLNEVEVTVAEDDWTLGITAASEFRIPSGRGLPEVGFVVFGALRRWGEPLLIEVGTTPGNPARRWFEVFETLRMDDKSIDPGAVAEAMARWAGEAPAGTPTARVLFLTESPVRPAPDADAAAPGTSPPRILSPVVKVPEYFGEAEMEEHGEAITALVVAPAGSLRAWCAPGRSVGQDGGASGPFFIRGTSEGMAALDRWVAVRQPMGEERQCQLEMVVRIRERGAAGTVIAWRNFMPVLSGRPSTVRTGIMAEGDADKSPGLTFLECEADCLETIGLADAGDGSWRLSVSGRLAPPIIDTPLDVRVKQLGMPGDGTAVDQVIGRTKGGREAILTIRLRDASAVASRWVAAPMLDLWWRKAAAEDR